MQNEFVINSKERQADNLLYEWGDWRPELLEAIEPMGWSMKRVVNIIKSIREDMIELITNRNGIGGKTVKEIERAIKEMDDIF